MCVNIRFRLVTVKGPLFLKLLEISISQILNELLIEQTERLKKSGPGLEIAQNFLCASAFLVLEH